MPLSKKQLDALKKIIERYHSALIFAFIGKEALTEEEKALLKKLGLPTSIEAIKKAYLYGKLRALLPPEYLGENEEPAEGGPPAFSSYEAFETWIAVHPVPLTEPEKRAVEYAQHKAAQHIRGLGNIVDLDTGNVIIEGDEKLRAVTEEGIREKVAEAVERRETIQELKSKLGHLSGDWSRDWHRIARSELVDARNQGQADTYRKKHGAEVRVFKQPKKDACPHCIRLYIGSDGYPKIFKLSTLEANGNNFNLKAKEYKPVVGPVHPNCQCTLHRVPDGWGFNQKGELVPGGTYGIMEDDLELSLEKGDGPSKGEHNFHGLKIIVENPAGSVRHWGVDGQTIMLVDYGYVDGTRGNDGDSYDVFVGPSLDSPFVYVVHQHVPQTGEYDEDKAILGCVRPDDALALYLAHYDDPRFFGSMSMLSVEEFKAKVLRTSKTGEDGMIKSRFVIKGDSIHPTIAAADSPAGGRNVQYGTAVNLLFNAPLREPTRKVITKEELTPVEPAHWVLREPEGYKRMNPAKLDVHPIGDYEHVMIEPGEVKENKTLFDARAATRQGGVYPSNKFILLGKEKKALDAGPSSTQKEEAEEVDEILGLKKEG